MNEANSAPAVLDAQGVAKRFGAVSALTDASLTVRAGEVVALMGANGAGKSTFVKILTGALRPDGGHVRIKGRDSTVGNPADARKSGLVPIYQEPSLIPDLDVADNLRLGNTPVEPFLRWVEELGIEGLRLDDMIGDLPLATLRILDLARALAVEPDVLLLDEMTAALPTNLVEQVLRVVRQQADAGRSVIFISHRFAEIAQLCDRATILRDGGTVADLPIEPGIEEKIVELMLGAALERGHIVTSEGQPAHATGRTPRLAVSGLSSGPKLRDVGFDLFPGEVLGVVALEGQGQDELFDVLSGFRRADGGTVRIDGQEASFRHPADAIAKGLTYVPGNRAEALLMERSVRENIALPLLARIRHWGPIRMRDEAARVGEAIDKLQIDTRAQGEVQRLSGGNQQKVTIGRWIATGVETLLLFDPTRGIDVRTKRQIYPLVRELAERGAAILYYTSELDEVQLACDRAIVIFNGRVVDVVDAAHADEQTLMRAAYGLTEQDRAEAVS
ncbi:sugar ABC transporter ATP-binding protein [Ponticoccus sp. SC2-23]|uniref:sugar ABC transporter ATP-binding protein n=1 Tax=Alexandriicola marinus TaxID=2081710 RepID=UPI000FD840F9|nr:sugar ABC transporter ATP-binding protein [Alexandriicola marinus]MBM1221660.1 sugar ABC transporter ATP-binding protein [Ponticoccus sp. SC6-9]MBM1226701.1 sugar ABC transporter ATP-binding protein [Ponticoccus sp. SC6-15]MBM1230652.1 sugar ABC transporter ATP-binding protein [Ponticoccus sp. SC6-38]MBM1235175.1 sugar ABC transporter ATP-binding protein [Ponticoccus sp. SC6-45]MBM1239673.1 sugar ABC transporter ATP-binding protein [Ponticoccus sp. SC6-49]MBM1243455.1 sugar ABC transporter